LGHGAKTPLRTVSLDGATDLAAGRETHPDCAGFGFPQWTEFQAQSGHDTADSFGGAKEIGALPQALDRRLFAVWRRSVCRGDQADSFLRPWARRRASTLRPPAVAMRARNPWRRFRTILLG
jgi:hypothetical protein